TGAGDKSVLDLRRPEHAESQMAVDFYERGCARPGCRGDDEHISRPAPDANGNESRDCRCVDGGISETGRPVGDHPGASFGCAEQSESPDEHEPTTGQALKFLLLRAAPGGAHR